MTSLMPREAAGVLTDLFHRLGYSAQDGIVRVEEFVEDGRLVIRADLPGVDPDRDLSVTVQGSVVHVSGERRSEEHDRRRDDIRYGRFERVFTIAAGTKADDVTAAYADGVLTVTAPLAVEGAAETHRVPIDRGAAVS